MKSFLQSDDIEIYPTYNEGKSVIAKRFIWTLKNKIYNYITLMSEKICIMINWML